MTAPITWGDAVAPIYWSNIGINWNSPAKAESPSYGVNLGHTNTGVGNVVGSTSFGLNLTATKDGTHTSML